MVASSARALSNQESYQRLAHLPDEDVYARLRCGDESALRVLFDRHVRMLRRLAMNILHDAHESEDVAQEVFATLWRNTDAWDGYAAKFSTWLHRVAINKAIDHRRRLRATPHGPVDIAALADAIETRTPAPAPERALDRGRIAGVVQTLLRELPPAQQSAITYFYFEELSVIEIAERMDLSQQAVRALLKRARVGLRTRLARWRARHELGRLSPSS